MADQKKKESILIWKNIKVKTEKINLIRDYPADILLTRLLRTRCTMRGLIL